MDEYDVAAKAEKRAIRAGMMKRLREGTEREAVVLLRRMVREAFEHGAVSLVNELADMGDSRFDAIPCANALRRRIGAAEDYVPSSVALEIIGDRNFYKETATEK